MRLAGPSAQLVGGEAGAAQSALICGELGTVGIGAALAGPAHCRRRPPAMRSGSGDKACDSPKLVAVAKRAAFKL